MSSHARLTLTGALYYPILTSTILSRAPPFITLEMKHLPRRKNRLERSYWSEEASSIADSEGKAINSLNQTKSI